MRTGLVLAGLGAVTLAALAPAPAEAETVTFTLTGSSLSLAEQPSVAMTGGGSTLAGSTISGSLGTTTVTDNRGGIAGWTSTIAVTTPLSNGTTTIPAGNLSAYVPALGIATTGVVTATSLATSLLPLTLSATPQTLTSATLVVGNNSATFNPVLSVLLPSNATAGSYSGVITQTVS